MTDHNWIDVRTQEDAAQGVGRRVCSGCGMLLVNGIAGTDTAQPAGPCTPPTDDCPEFGLRDCTVPQWLREEAALCEAEDGKLAWWLLEAADMIDSLSADAARYRWLRDGNGYAPEEGYARGGEDLDRLCDEGIREQEKQP